MSIYKRQSDNVKNFDSPQDFLKYYEKNKDEIDEVKTRSLNLKYKIKDHHIGRKQNKLILYPTNLKNINSEENEDINEKIDKLKNVIIDLVDRVSYLEECLSIKSHK